MKRATRRERFENIVHAFVIATNGQPPRDLGKLLAAIRDHVPDVTLEELRAAIRWSLRESNRRGRALERARRPREDSNPWWSRKRELGDDYDTADDFEASINACYRAVRERVANGGEGWKPK